MINKVTGIRDALKKLLLSLSFLDRTFQLVFLIYFILLFFFLVFFLLRNVSIILARPTFGPEASWSRWL